MKLKNYFISGIFGAAMLLGLETKAQDYNNARWGPNDTQSDNYVTLDTKTMEFSGMYIQKAFPVLGKNSKALIALPIAINKNGVDPKGLNVGYMQQKILGKEIYATIAAGTFEGPSGTLTQIAPQGYVTLLQNNWSIDLEGKINFDLETGEKTEAGSLTVGYGNSRVRGGASVSIAKNSKPSYQLLGRFDLTKDHKYWTEIYVTDDKTITLRFAANF